MNLVFLVRSCGNAPSYSCGTTVQALGIVNRSAFGNGMLNAASDASFAVAVVVVVALRVHS